MIEYSDKFNKDLRFYISIRNKIATSPINIVYDPNGVDFKQAFRILDRQKKLVPTKHPTSLRKIISVKENLNKLATHYAKLRGNSKMTHIQFEAYCIRQGYPKWFYRNVENLKKKYGKFKTTKK